MLALSSEEAEIAFLRQELNQATTRITILDNEIDDLNKTIKIQDQRLKIFESSQFSQSKTTGNLSTETQSATYHGSVPHHCCARVVPTCCRLPSYCQEKVNPDNNEKIEELVNEIQLIKTMLQALITRLPVDSPCSSSKNETVGHRSTPMSQECSLNGNRRDPDEIVTAEIHNSKNDVSINSIEEFIPEAYLNAYALTNQQTQV